MRLGEDWTLIQARKVKVQGQLVRSNLAVMWPRDDSAVYSCATWTQLYTLNITDI